MMVTLRGVTTDPDTYFTPFLPGRAAQLLRA